MHGVTFEEIHRLVSVIDYSEALTITATEEDAKACCRAARKYGFRAVVAFPQHLGVLVDELKDSGVRAQIPVAFPCGGATTRLKCLEAEQGLQRGATDLDMVMNLAAFKSGEYKKVAGDIGEVMAVARPFKVPFKVIVEIGILTEPEKITAGGGRFAKLPTSQFRLPLTHAATRSADLPAESAEPEYRTPPSRSARARKPQRQTSPDRPRSPSTAASPSTG